MVSYPTNLPARTLADDNQEHLDDHTEIATALSAITNVVLLSAATGTAATDTAIWQDALDLANGTDGVHIIAPAGTYHINATLKHYTNTRIQGAGWDGGTELAWYGGALGSRRSLLEAANFSSVTATQNSGFTLSDIHINGRGNTTGNGITGWWDKAYINHTWIEGFDGTSAGHGMGILMATDNVAGGTTLSGGENCFIMNSRFDTQRERIKNEAGGDQYTDGGVMNCEFLKAPGGNSDGDGIADIWLEQGGGWYIGPNNHFNGSLGHCIYVTSSAFTRIEGNFLDGWGCGPTGGKEYGAIYIDGFSSFRGGTGGPVIANNMWKARGWQNTTLAAASSWVAIKIHPGSIAFDATVTITGNGGWRRMASGDDRDGPNDATQGSGTAGNFCFQLDQSTANPGMVTYVLTGNNPEWYYDGTPQIAGSLPYSDASVFITPNSSTWPRGKAVFSGNSFQESTSTAAPAAGWWPLGTKRWHVPAASTAMGKACTASGVSGTWKDMPSYGA